MLYVINVDYTIITRILCPCHISDELDYLSLLQLNWDDDNHMVFILYKVQMAYRHL